MCVYRHLLSRMPYAEFSEVAHAESFIAGGRGLSSFIRTERPNTASFNREPRTENRASGTGPRASGLGPRASGFGFRASGFGPRVSGLGHRASGIGSRVSGLGSRASWLHPTVTSARSGDSESGSRGNWERTKSCPRAAPGRARLSLPAARHPTAAAAPEFRRSAGGQRAPAIPGMGA